MAQLTDRNSALEDAAKVVEAWAPFVEAQYNAGEIGRDEWRINQAATIVIANKIRQLKTQ